MKAVESVKTCQDTLLVSDLDGTLLNQRKKISAANKAAILSFIKNGGLFTFATGRIEQSVAPFVEQLGINIPLILYNGAKIYCPVTKNVLYEKQLKIDKFAFEAICSLHKEETSVFIYYRSNIYTPLRNRTVEIYEEKDGVECKDLGGSYHPDFVELDASAITKIVIIGSDEEKVKEVEQFIVGLEIKCDLVYSEANYLEILPKGVSKGEALMHLKKMLQVEAYKTIAIGDHLNDVTLLKKADIGIAVDNAHPGLKHVADTVTVHHEQHAVAAVISKVLKEVRPLF
ncbi:Cof-type HAD-IIB family hydrolase [Niallia sp. 03091]|uniref:Cof-type HAD-IIB family hydrolase n=1 Tax=unclassified Niallia TaxID=2837522 RepID=UPI004044F4EF